MNKTEEFEKLQYETSKSFFFTMLSLGIATIIAHASISSAVEKRWMIFFGILFFLGSVASLVLFFNFYSKLKKRYSP